MLILTEPRVVEQRHLLLGTGDSLQTFHENTAPAA